MHTYVIVFNWRGRTYEESIRCSSPLGAIAAVKARYPGSLISQVKQVH